MGDDVIGVGMIPGVGVQIGEGLAVAALAAIASLILDVLFANDHGVFRDGEGGVGLHNQLALNGQLAINDHVAGHGDGLTGGNVRAIVEGDVGLFSTATISASGRKAL